MEVVTDEGTQKLNRELVRQAFHLLVKVGVEKISGDIRNPLRQSVGQVICRCLQRDDIKEHALRGLVFVL